MANPSVEAMDHLVLMGNPSVEAMDGILVWGPWFVKLELKL